MKGRYTIGDERKMRDLLHWLREEFTMRWWREEVEWEAPLLQG